MMNSSVLVTPDSFTRAESDLYFARVVAGGNGQAGGFGHFDHRRAPFDLNDQIVIRLNRDTLYSPAVFDLDAGPVTVTLPDAGDRFMTMQIIDEDQYTYAVYGEPGRYTLTRDAVGTRYVLAAVRTLVDFSDPADLKAVHALQDKLTVEQASAGVFEIPSWDKASQDKVRKALLELAETLPDTNRMYGSRASVEPVRFLIGAAMGWGANPREEAIYLNRTPMRNDGKTVHVLKVGKVPVRGFWSVSLYNKDGYFEENDRGAYTVNDRAAVKDADGGITIQFGGDPDSAPNYLPIMPGWNYMVRLYRPEPELLDGRWSFPVEVAK